MSESRPPSRWALTPDAFEQLLRALDPDRERAAQRYEELRRRLHKLFRFWRCDNSWELADRTIDRVAVKLVEGATVPAGSMTAYVRSVARLIYYEAARATEQEAQRRADVPHLAVADAERERALGVLERCLETLANSDRRLILDYYGAQGGRTIDLRKQLAVKAEMSMNALRIRALRLRQKIEACVVEGMKAFGANRHMETLKKV